MKQLIKSQLCSFIGCRTFFWGYKYRHNFVEENSLTEVINSLFFKTTFKHLPRSLKNLEAFPLKLPRENLSLKTKLSLQKTPSVTVFPWKKIHWDFKSGTQNESVEEQTTCWWRLQAERNSGKGKESLEILHNLCTIFCPICHQL